MDKLQGFFLTVCAAAIFLSVLELIFSDGNSTAIRLACGIVMLIIVVSPLKKLKNFDLPALQFSKGSMDAWGQGFQTDEYEMMEKLIRENATTYIWDKAEYIGFTPTYIDIELQREGDTPIPARVAIGGKYTQEQRMELTQWIEENLGVMPKAQQWKWE